jgi:hypothetical protein
MEKNLTIPEPTNLSRDIKVFGLVSELLALMRAVRRGISRNTIYLALKDERPYITPLRLAIRTQAFALLEANKPDDSEATPNTANAETSTVMQLTPKMQLIAETLSIPI